MTDSKLELITVSYSVTQGLWALHDHSEPGNLIFMDGFESIHNHDDLERISGILGTWGYVHEGIHWKAQDGGWRVLVARA